MRKIDNPFIAIYPSVDLHGLDKISAIVKVKEFINDNIKLKNNCFVIIHGKGTGALKNTTHEYLRTDKRILSFKTDNFNDGITIVKLKGENNEQ